MCERNEMLSEIRNSTTELLKSQDESLNNQGSFSV